MYKFWIFWSIILWIQFWNSFWLNHFRPFSFCRFLARIIPINIWQHSLSTRYFLSVSLLPRYCRQYLLTCLIWQDFPQISPGGRESSGFFLYVEYTTPQSQCLFILLLILLHLIFYFLLSFAKETRVSLNIFVWQLLLTLNFLNFVFENSFRRINVDKFQNELRASSCYGLCKRSIFQYISMIYFLIVQVKLIKNCFEI